MRNFFAVIALVASSSSFAATLTPVPSQGPKVTFKQNCQWAQADISGGDIEFSRLNLDINAQQWIQSRRCEITTQFPGQPGKKLVVSTFNVQALADLKHQGVAILTLRHNFKNWGWKQEEARALVPGAAPLSVTAKAIGTANCGEPITLQTEILTAARNGNLLQDSAVQISQVKYSYEKCW